MNDTSSFRAQRQQVKGRQWRIWTEQLYREYDEITYQYRLSLNPPFIRIDEARSRWGAWDPATRTLTISAALIELYPWDVVIEILKHEMAHQWVSDRLGGDHTHGADFRQACQLLGVADWAARASGELPDKIPHWKDRSLSRDEERLMNRVEKLLSLAESTNEHEALLAMEKVQEIYTRYNINRIRDRNKSELVYLIFNRKKKRIEATESTIFSILNEHFFVRCIFSSLYDAQDLCEYRVVEVMGSRENVLMAEYVYHFLWDRINVLWQTFRSTRGKDGRAKRSYQLGVLYGFRDKLQHNKSKKFEESGAGRQGEAADRALLKLDDAKLHEYVQQRFPKLVSRGWRSGYGDGDAYDAGVAAGQRLNLHRGVTRSDGNRGRMLPPK